MKRFMSKKVLVVGVVVAVLLGVGGAAFAYFSTTGTGNGTAQVGNAAGVTISQIGPGYDSLVTGNGYVQDQCFECAQVTEFGNEVNLSTTGILSNVVVAMRNWGDAVASLPVTLAFYEPGATAGTEIISDTQNFYIPAAIVNGSDPSVFNITFDFSSYDFPLPSPVVYGISFDYTLAPSLNVALSNAATQNTVGSDVYPGYVYVNDASPTAFESDAGTCATLTPGTFMATEVWCGDTPIDNYGAYGNSSGADIPAVEINVVGGTTPPLYPGDTQEVDFAITNPNPGSVYVNTVTIALNNNGTDVLNQYSSDISGCLESWFNINGSYPSATVTLAQNIPSGLTQFLGQAHIYMINEPVPQNACAGATIGLNFSSN